MALDYDIAFSGSSGNSARLDNIMIDIGVRYKEKEFQNMLRKTKAIFISHRHGDHLNMSTYLWLAKFYPRIPIYVNEDLWNFIGENRKKNLHLIHDGDEVSVEGNLVHIFHTTHEKGVQTNGYDILFKDFSSAIYVTDFKKWSDLPDDSFDYFFLEANHDADYYKVISELYELKGTYMPSWLASSSGRHTSKQDTLKFFNEHKNEDSILYELHKSGRFFDITDYKDELNFMIKNATFKDPFEHTHKKLYIIKRKK